jgi:serine protease Do
VVLRCLWVTAAFGFAASVPAAVEAGEFETVVLKDGQKVVAEVIAERPTAIYVDLGYDILKIPKDQVLRRAKGVEASTGARPIARALEEDSSGFYTSGVLKPSPIKELVGKFGEAVISIETPSGKGSGFLINKEGYAITNDHVVQGESRISAILYLDVPGGFSRRRIEDVELIALNPFVDLALLKLPLPPDLKPTHVILGNADDVNAGDTVFAVGNPLGLERSVSQGIVSNRSRSLEGQLFLQTDTAINPGNSGGPLFNQRGEVIGVTSRGFHAAFADNLGFAIPVSYVKEFIHHREAFAYDKANPNSGFRYLDPPRRLIASQPEGLKSRESNGKKAAESGSKPGAPAGQK